jgi:hypothetical protein
VARLQRHGYDHRTSINRAPLRQWGEKANKQMIKTIQPGPNLAPYPMAGGDVEAMRKWDEGRAAEDALHANAQAEQNYLNNTWKTWFTRYNNAVGDGGDRRIPPPQPPKGFVAQIDEDDTVGAGGARIVWELVQSGPPVCEIPSYSKLPGDPNIPAPPPSATPDYIVGDVVVADSPARDGLPVGFPIVKDDGSKWQKKARMLPFGTAYFWQKVSAMLLLAALLVFTPGPAAAQLTVAFSPEPLAVTQSLRIKEMGPWACFIRNDGPVARTVTVEDILIAGISRSAPSTRRARRSCSATSSRTARPRGSSRS